MKLALFALLSMLPCAAQAVESTANEVFKLIDKGNQQERNSYILFLSMTETGMAWANTFLQGTRKEEPIYCVPQNVSLTGDQLLNILRREVRKDASLGSKPYGLALLLSLRSAFPCKQ